MVMVSQSDLITAARKLAGRPSEPTPTQASLRRAVSTTYYALFHCMAENCADMLVGGLSSGRSEPAWLQAYRALEHGLAKQRCREKRIARFPLEIQSFAGQFATMQEKREAADYNPVRTFEQSTVIADIDLSAEVITQFHQSPERDRRAFAVYVLHKLRDT